MISLAVWWNKHLVNVSVFKKFTCAYKQQIALKILLLPTVDVENPANSNTVQN